MPFRRLAVLLMAPAVLAALAGGAIALSNWVPTPRQYLKKQDLAALFLGQERQVSRCGVVRVKHPELGDLNVTTTLDCELMGRARRLLATRRDKSTALVLAEADTGRVLVLAGAQRGRPDLRAVLEARAPAASLYKIVTAAAAVEEARLDSGDVFEYAGRPHTLYRYQLRRRPRRRTRLITLAESFARSNNVVFARLGLFILSPGDLVRYGKLFYFGKKLPFELNLGMSRLAKPSHDFRVAEVASGFNRETTISPVHAAMLVAAFLNGGTFMEPYLIKRVENGQGWVLYRGRPRGEPGLVTSRTCRVLREMMEATVFEGTARRAFRRAWWDRILKGLNLGGKTGTIASWDRSRRFQWFAGFAYDPISGRKLVVASLVVNGRRRWSDPKVLARKMLRAAFNPQRRVERPRPVLRPGG